MADVTAVLEYDVDLERGYERRPLPVDFGSGDDLAHMIIVTAHRGKTEVDLAGIEVLAYINRADNATVLLTGTVENGKVLIHLTESCYAINGRVWIVVKFSDGDTRSTVLWLEGNINRTSNGAVVDPEELIPSIDELLVQIKVIEDAVERAEAAADRAENAGGTGGTGSGTPGADGFSPIATVTQTDDGAVITITDKTGTTTATIANGAPGPKGDSYTLTDADKTAIAQEAAGLLEENDPTVPAWAKASTKPTYTAAEVGALPSTYTPPNQTAAQVGADPAGTAASKVSTHNADEDAHPAIRQLVSDLAGRLNALADSDDTTLDQLSEIVAYIKSNKALIDSITTGKVSTADIVNNLTSTATTKPLSAAQGKALKALIDAIVVPTKLSELAGDATHRVVTDAEKTAWNAKSTFSGKYADLTGKPTIPSTPEELGALPADAEIVDKTARADVAKLSNCVTPQMFGAKGDGTTDDTAAMQAAFTDVAVNGKYLFIPKGRYKVTSPITIDWSSTSTTKRNFLQKIIGAGSQAFEKYYDNSVIVGYNIPANRGVIELIGNGNTWGTETRIEDLGIECDKASCDPMSFALKYGDARNFKLHRVKLRGHNAVLARCGSIVDSSGNSTTKGYEQINVKFEQCDFYTFDDNTKGFAFLPEGVITGQHATMDNIVVDSCCISGVWVIASVNIMFQSCQVYIPNIANKAITTDNVGKLNGYAVDYGTGFYVGQAMSAVFQNCYFEDHRRSFHITPTLGSIRNVSIMNCYMNPGSNQFNADGSRLNADYGVLITPGTSSGVVRNVLVQNNVFRLVDGDTEFAVASVRNECAEHFVFRDNCTTSSLAVTKVENTTTSGYDIQNGKDSGASVKSMTTSADGKTLTIELTNGKSTTFNTGASAPVKGVDYFTAAEVEEIKESAAALAKAELQQIPPPTWVESVDDMTDESKNYVLLETGNIWAYMTTRKSTEDVIVPAFTNLMDDPGAYIKDGYRYSQSSAEFKAQASDCSIVIPLSYIGACTLRVRGANIDGCAYPNAIYLGTTNEEFAQITQTSRVNSTDANGDLVITFTTSVAQNNGCKYCVFMVADGVDASNLIVTLNEEIKYTTQPGGTETVTGWTDTGHNIVQG